MPIKSLMPGAPALNLLNAVTTGTSNTVVYPSASVNNRIEVTGAGTISGGTVLLEENSTDPNYSGLWSQLYSVTASTLTGGAKQTFHISGGIGFVRVRISSNITGGGTISADAVASMGA